MQFKLRNLVKSFRFRHNEIIRGEAKFQALTRYAGDSIFIIDKTYQIIEVNESACKLLNYTAEELQHKKIFELMADDEQHSFKITTEIINKEGGSLHERKFKRKDGSLVETEVNVRPVEGIGYISIIRDITERKKAEAKIVERESLLTALFDNIEGSLALYDVNKRIVLFNSQFAHNYKLLTNREPKAGDAAHDFLSEEMRKEPSQLMDSALKGNKEIFEKNYLSNGKHVSFRTSFNPVINDGKVTGVTSFSLDLTKKREAEQKVLENEEKFRMSFMTSRDTFYIGTLEEGRVIDVNNSFYDLFGYTRDEVIGKTSTELKLYVNAPERAKMVAALKADGNVKDLELTCRKKSGELFIASLTVNLWQMNNEQVIMAVIRDVTEKKQIEKELMESEIRFREVLENSLSASYKRNLQTNAYDYLSPVFKKIAGYTQDEMNSLPLDVVIGMMHPDDVQVVTNGITRAINQAAGTENTLEYRFKHKATGEYHWLNDEFAVIKDAEGQPISLIGSVSDITERKRIETELVESKEQMALFVEYSPASLAMFDNEMRYIATSRRWMTAYNLGDQQIIGKSHYEVFPEITQHWKDIHQRCLQGNIERNDEDSFTRADGTMDWLKWEIRPWHKASGEIGGIIMFTEVITEQKESALKFKNLVEKSFVGVYIIQKGKYAYVNPRFAQFLGYTEEEMYSMEDARDIVSPGYTPAALLEWRRKVSEGIIDDFQFELQYKRKDGTIIWAEVNCGETFYKGSKAILGTFQDITERKNAEAIIKEQAETFSAIIENAVESIWLLSPDLKVLQFNKTGKDRLLLHRGKEIYTGADFREFLRLNSDDVFMPMFNEALTGKYCEQESSQIDIHGEIFWLRTRMYPVYDTQKKLIGITVLGENITDRKKAEENIKQSEASYRQLFDNSPAPMWVINEKTSAIMQVNKACIKNYGFSEEEFLAMKIGDISPGQPELTSKTDMLDVFFMGSQRHVKKSGELIDVVTSSIPIRLNEEKNTLLIAIDVTEKNLYEQKLTKAAIKVQEEERYEIGGELHDNVCQILAGSLMTLGLMKTALPHESIEMFNLTHKYINQATSEIRNLSHRLAPAFFDRQTLDEAITELLKSINVENRYSMSLNVDAQFEKLQLNRDLQLNMYRILQEQLRNIVKHAKATEIKVDIAIKKNNILQMKIGDNGVGFNAKASKGGIGLANMNRRVQLFSGTFSIISAVGKGCRVLVEIPLSKLGSNN